MTDKNQIKQYLQDRLKELEAIKKEREWTTAELGDVACCKQTLVFIDSLQEEPVSNELEAEFVLYLKRRFNIPQEGNTLKTDGWSPSPYDLLDIAKHFAQWQKKQMINEVCDPFKEPEFTMEIKKKTIEEQIYALTTVLRYSKEEIEKHINVKPLQDLLEQLKQRIGG